MIPTSLQLSLDAARSEVLGHPKHEFSFATRKRLLLQLGPVLVDDRGKHTLIYPGLRRRARLCIASVQKVLPFWEAVFSSKDPQTMLDLSEGYLAGKADWAFVRKKAYSFGGGLENRDAIAQQRAWLVGRASICAAYTATADELLEVEKGITPDDVFDPQDPDLWDCAFWASAAWAGGMPWVKEFDRERYRDFWLWYLDTEVPAAWESVNE
jgi:hypothetical protein